LTISKQKAYNITKKWVPQKQAVRRANAHYDGHLQHRQNNSDENAMLLVNNNTAINRQTQQTNKQSQKRKRKESNEERWRSIVMDLR